MQRLYNDFGLISSESTQHIFLSSGIYLGYMDVCLIFSELPITTADYTATATQI